MVQTQLKVSTKFVAMMSVLSLMGCLNSADGGSSSLGTSAVEPGSLNANTVVLNPILKVSLTDAPNKSLKSVFVNVAQIELFLKKNEVEKRLVIGKNLGAVDLLQLSNGVMLPLLDAEIPPDVEVREIRLVLNNDQNYAIESNDSICPMQTPSGQQSGVKIKFGTPFKLESGYKYSLVVDFDAKKSVVVKGNGGCLLKPVIKIPAVTRQLIVVTPPPPPDVQVPPTTPTTPDPGVTEPVTDGSDTNVQNPSSPYLDADGFPLPADQLGFDPYDPSTYPPEVTIDDLYMYF